MDWLEKWAARRQIREAALAVFGEPNANIFSATATPELSRFAERHELNFVLGDGAVLTNGYRNSFASVLTSFPIRTAPLAVTF
jgi:hypothetical protein